MSGGKRPAARVKNPGPPPLWDFCGEPFDEFVIKYRNRKQLDIWKLRDPAHPYLRDEDGRYVLDKDGHKITDTIAHITLFDTHPFFQQSFVNAMGFLVKSGKAQRSDFHFMEDMKKKRGRFSLELAPVPETG
jgi:hypothetical protein